MAYLARRILDDMVKEIASHFNRSHVTTGEAIIKVKILLQKDKSFKGIEFSLPDPKTHSYVLTLCQK